MSELREGQRICKVSDLRDKGIVSILIPQLSGDSSSPAEERDTNAITGLAYLPPKFRGVLFIRRGAFLVISPTDSTSDKVSWIVDSLLRSQDIKYLKKQGVWPPIFGDNIKCNDSSEDENSDENSDEAETEEEE